jgi:hypothetical protein
MIRSFNSSNQRCVMRHQLTSVLIAAMLCLGTSMAAAVPASASAASTPTSPEAAFRPL